MFVPVFQQPIASFGTKNYSSDYKVNWHFFKNRRRQRKVQEKGRGLCKQPFKRRRARKTKWQIQTRKNCERGEEVILRTPTKRKDVRKMKHNSKRKYKRNRKGDKKRKDNKKRRDNRKRKYKRKRKHFRKRKDNMKRKDNRKRNAIKDDIHLKKGKYLQSRATINEEWSYLEKYLPASL